MTDKREPKGLSPATFHAREGVADWNVTSWGPQACFRGSSLAHTASIVPRILAAAARFDLEPDVDLRPEAIVVRIPYDEHAIPAAAADLAAEISVAAVECDLVADPSAIQTVDIAVAQHPEVDARPFWAAALAYDVKGDTDAVDPLRRGPSLSFMDITPAAPGRGRSHIDVSVPADRALARVDAAIAAGGRLVDDSRAPMWWTLASPDNHGIDIAAWTDTWE